MNSADPLVSILINNYNYGLFLREAIDSALQQTYTNTEIIVVDDGSTDDSREIIAAYGSRIIPVLKENGGQASAVNAGVAMCRGELICFLDSDDTWHTSKVEEVVRAARSYPKAVLIYHKFQSVSREFKLIDRVRPTSVFRGSIEGIVQRSGGSWDRPPTSGLSFRKSVLDRVGKIPEDKFGFCDDPGLIDGYLSYLVPFLGGVVGLDHCLSYYRLHGKNKYANPPQEKTEFRRACLRQYEALIYSVNRELQLLGVPSALDLKNHWNYQALKYKLKDADRLSFLELAWRALVYPGVPSLMDRLRWVARFSLDSLGYKKA